MARSYYYKEIENSLTGERVFLKAADKVSLSMKVQKQYERWERERIRSEKAEKKQQAIDKTELAIKTRESLQNILNATLEVDDKIDWMSLLDRRPYPADKPNLANFTKDSISKSLSFIPALKKKALAQKESEEAAYEKALAEYEKGKAKWELEQKESNSTLARNKIAYEKGSADGIETYVSLVLDRSNYPDILNINGEVLFDEKTGTLLVELDLPSCEQIPRIEAHKYISSRDVIEEKPMKERVFSELYNTVLYQIMLRTLHEIFESDYKQWIKSVVLNGNAMVSNKATGASSTKTIATIQVQRDEFLAVNLANVEPAACFRHFKGITAGSLVDLTPVKPILKLDRKDNRIIEASNVLEEFDPTQNLAMMPWEEFEVLIRDLIQKEFSGEGATVEVTRASRDAGVDAIAFDEDPIRGGKFVIQAKRYNNLVPLTAVRDLFGTVHNEGAVKGILVTTSYYGPDAISFAKDKPLTLMNGEQLLYMFQKHGYDFKISLKSQRAASSKLV
jgi:restriction system protein